MNLEGDGPELPSKQAYAEIRQQQFNDLPPNYKYDPLAKFNEFNEKLDKLTRGNMVEKIETTIFQAQAYWCKVLGKPRPSYDGKKNEWTVDLLLDKDALKALQAFGIDRFYVKKGKPNKDGTTNELTGKPVLKLTRADKKANGEATKPIPIRDEHGRPWDQSKLIGNGSVVNVKIMKYEVKLPGQPARQKPYLLEMQVWDHVEYEGKGDDGGFPTKEGKASDKANSDDWDFDAGSSKNHQPDVDFDDEIPFD